MSVRYSPFCGEQGCNLLALRPLFMLDLAVKMLCAYLLGSVVGSLLLGSLSGVDIRSFGSGNAGGTNALRTQGKWFALGVIAIDIGKGWLATTLLPTIYVPGVVQSWPSNWLMCSCALAAIIGHVYPIWYEFRGGKGAATLFGAVLGVAPYTLLPVIAVWALIIVLTGYVGLATMLASVALPVVMVARRWPTPDTGMLCFALLAAVFVIYTHRANIARMLQGTEHRAHRVWLFGRRKTVDR